MKNVGTTGIKGFAGDWIYRSFSNNPELDAPADEVLFSVIELKLEVAGAGGLSTGLELGGISGGLDIGGSGVSGRLSFDQEYLTVSGKAKSGDPPTIRFRATGVDGTFTAGWIYDYIGYLAPSWPNGVEQRPAILGTVIRTVPHAGGGGEVRPAGFTLSFIAVLRD